MTRQCAVLEEQRTWRDLRRLGEVVMAPRWVDSQQALLAPEPLVACGLWAAREPSAGTLLRRRAEAGRSSLLVARFEPGDLGPIIGAPVAVHVKGGEAGALAWEDGRRYQVPSVTVIETALADGHWAHSTAGTTVLAFRPHTQSGLMVVCTATVAGPALGSDASEQRALLERLLDEVERCGPERPATSTEGSPATATVDEYLDRHGADGALVLMASLAEPGALIDGAALAAIGAALPAERLSTLAAALPSVAPGEAARALRDAGWGAHLRALAARRTEGP